MSKLKEVDLVGEAIRGTEEEIMAAAMSGGDDDDIGAEDGDRSLEDMGEGLEGQSDDGDADDGDQQGEDGDRPRDERGRFTAKDPQGGDQDGHQQAQEGQQGADQAGQADHHDSGQVPRPALLEERSRRQQAEQRFETYQQESQRQIGELNARLDTMLQMLTTRQAPAADQRGQPQDQQAEQPVDFFENPDAYLQRAFSKVLTPIAEQIQTIQQQNRETRHEVSMRSAHARHQGVFEKAYQAFTQLDPRNPADLQDGRRIANAQDPGEAMVKWYKDREVLREVGDDPAAYRAKVEKDVRDALLADPEFKRQLLGSMRDEATGRSGNSAPRSVNRLPPSLNGSRGGQVANNVDPSQFDNSEAAVFDYVWDRQ